MRHGRIVGLIQVAYTLDGVKTRKREIAPLFGAARKLGCSSLTVITDHERETIGENGLVVEVLPAREWLAAKGFRYDGCTTGNWQHWDWQHFHNGNTKQ